MIGGLRYRKLGGMYIREDTVTNKVYLSAGTIDEQLLYDYNLMPGDTMIVYTTGCCGTISSQVIGIDSTQINGRWYKIWHFQRTQGLPLALYYYVVEGIGCINGLDFPVREDLQEYFGQTIEQILCFDNNGVSFPLTNPIEIAAPTSYLNYNFDNASSCTLGTDKIVAKTENATVSPDPVNASSKIVLSYNMLSGSLVVVNDLGQVVINSSFKNKEELPIGVTIYTPGIYYYRVTDNANGNMFSGKFVNQ
jgi:hypothetical protein